MTTINFCNHTIIDQSPDDYVEIETSPSKIFSVWKLSFFAHELLNQDGGVKAESEITGDTLQKYIDAMESIRRGEDIPKPVLGVGIYDGIEIGIGREVIAAAYHSGVETIPTHVRKGQRDEIENLLS